MISTTFIDDQTKERYLDVNLCFRTLTRLDLKNSRNLWDDADWKVSCNSRAQVSLCVNMHFINYSRNNRTIIISFYLLAVVDGSGHTCGSCRTYAHQYTHCNPCSRSCCIMVHNLSSEAVRE